MAAMVNNGTESRGPDMGKAQLSLLSWLEPVIILSTLLTALILSRRKNYSIFQSGQDQLHPYSALERSPHSSQDSLLDPQAYEDGSDSDDSLQREPVAPLPRRQSSLAPTWTRARFSHHVHSRILTKLPFLIEMFYWILNYVAYRLSKQAAAAFHGQSGDAVVHLAQDHGISILSFEHDSAVSFFFAVKETDVQRFFLQHHTLLMSIINQFYSLVHIPGTVAFISWYYYSASTFDQFATARRTMTLGNFVAFLVFAAYPCMPPRLLPKSFGFKDTVRQSHAESVWVGEGGKSGRFNQLAAMPSLHFTYALVIGCTLFWHSGLLQSLAKKPRERSFIGMVGFGLAGILYPMFVLLVIVATANHYYLDAVMATFSVIFCFLCNRVWLILLPAERLLALILRVDKPLPTTGQHRAAQQAQIEAERANHKTTIA